MLNARVASYDATTTWVLHGSEGKVVYDSLCLLFGFETSVEFELTNYL